MSLGAAVQRRTRRARRRDSRVPCGRNAHPVAEGQPNGRRAVIIAILHLLDVVFFAHFEMSDHYTVLARRFRPQTFDDVVGQEHVGRAIQNAIRAGRVAHAYLFTGARGVGKTSTARIFAKAMNCPNSHEAVPCNECDVCEAIGNGTDVDVLEIDGASNRGIDDIRQLRANVNIRSMRSPFKVYIIDEVHMLTKEAFNALLKTLEEPPPNVKFIFCTTEPHKVPDTILSRCQRFDFGTITSSRIGDRLTEIATAEGVAVDEEAVAMVARRAAGSMRDSQSLFDQLLAFGGEQITTDDVHRLFGTAPDERIVGLMEAVLGNDRATAIQLIDESLNSGVRLDSLSDQLVAYVRDLLVLASGASTVPLTSVAERLRDALGEQATRWGLRTAMAAMQILSDTKLKMSRTVHARPLLELAVIRLSLLEDLDGLASLVQAARSGELGSVSAPRVVDGGQGDLSKKKTLEPATEPVPQVTETLTDRTQVASMRPEAAVSVASNGGVRPSAQPVSEVRAASTERGERKPPTMDLSVETFDEFWNRLVKIVPERLGNALVDSKQRTLTADGCVQVQVATEFALSYLESEPSQKRLRSLTQGLTGAPVRFEFTAVATAASAAPALIRDRQVEPQMRKKSSVDDDEFVQSALELFGGQLVQVKSVPAPVLVTADQEIDEELVDALNVEDTEDA